MALTNGQYDLILQRIRSRRKRAEAEFEARKEKLDRDFPELRLLRERLSDITVRRLQAKLSNDEDAIRALRKEEADVQASLSAVYEKAGVDPLSFGPRYSCNKCNDTGIVNGKKCSCFLSEELSVLYGSSHLTALLRNRNFGSLSTELYSSERKPGAKESVRDLMMKQIGVCRTFAERFDEEHGSLLLYGPPGTGKTFLSCCIANELLATRHAVLYFSAVTLFDLLSKELRRDCDAPDEPALSDHLTECDLLIIDDLGTELVNAYTNSRLFHVVNERLLLGKSTVISTNLTLNELRERYSERIASRIVSEYRCLSIPGEDLRLKKKMESV